MKNLLPRPRLGPLEIFEDMVGRYVADISESVAVDECPHGDDEIAQALAATAPYGFLRQRPRQWWGYEVAGETAAGNVCSQ